MSIRFVPAQGYDAVRAEVGNPAAGDRKPSEPRDCPRKAAWLRGFAMIFAASLVVGLAWPMVAQSLATSRRNACRDRMKRIGAALHEFVSERGTFPAAVIYDRAGRPLLSWRVAILPQLGRRDLYDEFRLDEPWDSPHNRALVERMPEVFACPAGHTEAGLTHYLALHGPQAMFDGREGVSLSSVTDGASNTILVAEASRAVPWTKPEEHEYSPLNLMSAEPSPLPGFGSLHVGGFHALFADGAVRFIKTTVQETVLRHIITRDGGEVISA